MARSTTTTTVCDVCSSDLPEHGEIYIVTVHRLHPPLAAPEGHQIQERPVTRAESEVCGPECARQAFEAALADHASWDEQASAPNV